MVLPTNHIIQGDTLTVLKTFPDACIDCVVSSPPYWSLRDYGVEGQLGLEPTLEAFLHKMLAVTAELKRVLKPTGTLWWNHGDCYSTGGKAVSRPSMSLGSTVKRVLNRDYIPPLRSDVPEKSLVLQNYRLTIRMVDEQAWILRNVVVWHKSNVMPASVRDRFTIDYEPMFFGSLVFSGV